MSKISTAVTTASLLVLFSLNAASAMDRTTLGHTPAGYRLVEEGSGVRQWRSYYLYNDRREMLLAVTAFCSPSGGESRFSLIRYSHPKRDMGKDKKLSSTTVETVRSPAAKTDVTTGVQLISHTKSAQAELKEFKPSAHHTPRISDICSPEGVVVRPPMEMFDSWLRALDNV